LQSGDAGEDEPLEARARSTERFALISRWPWVVYGNLIRRVFTEGKIAELFRVLARVSLRLGVQARQVAAIRVAMDELQGTPPAFLSSLAHTKKAVSLDGLRLIIALRRHSIGDGAKLVASVARLGGRALAPRVVAGYSPNVTGENQPVAAPGALRPKAACVCQPPHGARAHS
jgi:hypothetical protein